MMIRSAPVLPVPSPAQDLEQNLESLLHCSMPAAYPFLPASAPLGILVERRKPSGRSTGRLFL